MKFERSLTPVPSVDFLILEICITNFQWLIQFIIYVVENKYIHLHDILELHIEKQD